MKKTNFLLIAFAAVATLGFNACAGSKKAVIPVTSEIKIEDTYTIIWNGKSEAYRFNNGNWLREPSFDYQFNVIQKRYGQTWKSVKTLHRLHPDYNGKAGERHQTMYFEINYTNVIDSLRKAAIRSSIGNGNGKSDQEYRKVELSMDIPNASRFSPYNKIRITQHYQYEKGVLTETVLLFRIKDGKEILFMKNEETAYFYTKGKLDKAPM